MSQAIEELSDITSGLNELLQASAPARVEAENELEPSSSKIKDTTDASKAENAATITQEDIQVTSLKPEDTPATVPASETGQPVERAPLLPTQGL